MSLDAPLVSQLLLALAGALMGAFAGGAVYWTAAGRNQRLKLTLDLYAEFHSPQFNHVRIAAHAAMQGAPMPQAYASGAKREAREAISSVVHFWEKVAQLLPHRRGQRALAAPLLRAICALVERVVVRSPRGSGRSGMGRDALRYRCGCFNV